MIRSLALSDKEMAELLGEDWKHEIRNKVEAIFKNSYEKISKNELHKFTKNFTSRIYLFKGSLPMTLSKILLGVLYHKNLQNSDK